MSQASAFARVIGAMQASLQLDLPVSPNVFRTRTRVVPKQMATAVVLRPGEAEREQGVGSGTPGIWLTAVAVECYARASAGIDADEAVDALLSATVERLQVDPTLGGLVGDVSPQNVNWDFDTDGEQTACATVTFFVRHATAAGLLPY